jgi:hypothetical protein
MSATGIQLTSSALETINGLQNVTGTGNNAGFFRPNNSLLAQVGAGWIVNDDLNWKVVSATCDVNDQYSTGITTTGGSFVLGSFYSLSLVSGLSMSDGVTITG